VDCEFGFKLETEVELDEIVDPVFAIEVENGLEKELDPAGGEG
jgi:hypothetical protein